MLFKGPGSFKNIFLNRRKCWRTKGLSIDTTHTPLLFHFTLPLRRMNIACQQRPSFCIFTCLRVLMPRRLLRSSRPQEICQPRREGFFSVHGLSGCVHAQLQLLRNIFRLFSLYRGSSWSSIYTTTMAAEWTGPQNEVLCSFELQ